MIVRIYHTLRDRQAIALRRYLSVNGDCDDAEVRRWAHQLIDDEIGNILADERYVALELMDARANTEQPHSNAQEATNP